MIRFDDILYFDTETTGVPGKGLSWETDFDEFPRIVQLGWIYRGREHSLIIYPDNWEVPEQAEAVHGICTEKAIRLGVSFDEAAKLFIADCRAAKMLCGHNIYFDTSIVKAQILYSLGRDWYDAERVEDALYKGKRIDTMRPAMKWVDARTQDGRLKFPSLAELYSRCFPGESFPAHDALEDVRACQRCLPVLVEQGLVKLEVKTYPEDGKQGDIFRDSPETQRNGPISATNSKDIEFINPEPKGPQIAKNEKISELLKDILI